MSAKPYRPNLFIVGAMKSGTTSLHYYLDAHPDIFMSQEKEPGFFVREFWRDKPEATYLSLFQAGAGRRYRGESSTHYAKLPTYPGVPARIRAYSPDAKLIYIMRHPVERTISHYWHAVRDVHLSRENRSVVHAIRADNAYTAYSDYAMQLQAYLEVFPRSALYCLTLEALLADPHRELARIFGWLGLPAIALQEMMAHNPTPEAAQRVAGFGILNHIRYASWWAPFSRCIPKRLRQRASAMAYTDVVPKLTAEERNAIANLLYADYDFAGKIAALTRLLGREFPEWSAGSAPEAGPTCQLNYVQNPT